MEFGYLGNIHRCVIVSGPGIYVTIRSVCI